MRLDFVEKTGAFVLEVARSEGELIQSLMREHGLDFSLPASTPERAVLFTHEPYAAATFEPHATARARTRLAPLLAQISASWEPDSRASIRVPADRDLWPFQRASVAYALGRDHTLIGDQPGLGKTPIAIAFANEVRAERILVICPASIRIQWAKRIREWSTMRWPLTIHPILNGRHGVHPTAHWTVCSYDLARTPAIQRALTKHRYDVLILDEAHYLKTVDSLRTRAVFGGGEWMAENDLTPIMQSCRRVLALTGTPLPNRPREAYTLARNLCFDSIDWMSEASFSERFNPAMRIEKKDKNGRATGFYIDERTGRHAELQNRLRGNFMVRHLKKDVLKQLPDVIHDIVQMDETGPVKQALHAESLLDINPEKLEGLNAEIMGHIAVVRHQMGVALAPQVADYGEMILDGGEEKLVIFAHHKRVLDILQTRLEKFGVVRVDGNCSPVQKQQAVNDFRLLPQIRIFIGNLLSVGVGTDGLQEVCRHMLFAESSWVFGDNQQGIDRLHRGGQKQGVYAEFCVAPNSISERILGSALRKGGIIHKALDARVN